MNRKYELAVSCILLLPLGVSWGFGQTTGHGPSGLAISGPSPWIDPTSPVYGAYCNGSTDDTAAIQSALSALAPAGGTLFIPPTSSTTGCLISGVHTTISAAPFTGTCGSGNCTVTIPVGSTTGFTIGGLVNIHGVSPGAHTTFNGTYAITVIGTTNGSSQCGGTGSTPCIGYALGGVTDTSSFTGSHPVAEIGLWYVGNNLKVLGAAAGSGAATGTNPSGSMLVTGNPITILTTLSSVTGPDVQNMTFRDSSTGNAYAGLVIGNTNGFNVSNNGFSGFNGTGTLASGDSQGGAAIVASAGQATTSGGTTPWVQFGKIQNNHIDAKLGFTAQYLVSSVVFDNNRNTCPPGTGDPTKSTIGLDLGGLWYLTNGSTLANSTGGENRVINQQSQGCMIGTLLGSQNNDRVEEKSENDGSTNAACDNGTTRYCTIGMALVNTYDSALHAQSKYVNTGLYLDKLSTNNMVYENTTWVAQGPPSSTASAAGATLNNLCPTTTTCPNPTSYSFSTASLVVDPAALPSTVVFGTNSGQTVNSSGHNYIFPTSNSTFGGKDNEPSGVSATVAGTNVALTAQGDPNNSDIFDVYTNPASSVGGPAINFALNSSALPTVGNHGYISALGAVTSGGTSGYVVGDVLTVPGPGSGATALVTAVTSAGVVSTLSLLTGGTGYGSAGSTNLSGGSGTGTVTIASTTASSTNGTLALNGAAGGTVTIQPRAGSSFTSYNFNLPAAAGTSGQPLLSGGGGTTVMTFGTLGVAAGGTGLTSTPSNGALLIGNGTNFTETTLTAQNGVSVMNGSGSITLDEVNPVGFTFPPVTGSGKTGTVGNGAIQLTGFYLPTTTTFTGLVFEVATAGAGGNMDFGIYDTTGTLKAHVGASNWSAAVHDVTISSVTLAPGKYYWAVTSADGTPTVQFRANQTGASFLASGVSTSTSTGGALPASTVSIPMDSWKSNGVIVWGAIHN